MSSDIERIRRDVLLSETALQFGVALKKNGDEFEACCPVHNDKTASFTVFTGKDGIQRFHCFGCGVQGDVLDFTREIKGVDLREAIKILGGSSERPNIAPRQIEVRDVYAGIVPIVPAAGTAIERRKSVRLFNPKRAGTEREYGSLSPSMVFPYRKSDGSLIGYVLRHDFQDGGKETPMVMWVRLPNGKECWSRFPFPKPRPLYGLETIGDARQVIVVEGEKCADRLREATGRIVVSWAGGTQGVKHADWSPLAGRNVVIWPDWDRPGFETANEIASMLLDIGATPRMLTIVREGE